VKSIQRLTEYQHGTLTYNIGTGTGYSVKQVIDSFKEVSGKEIKVITGPRRPGDIAECTADSSLANTELGWHANFGLTEMITSAWHWQSKNPRGYSNKGNT